MKQAEELRNPLQLIRNNYHQSGIMFFIISLFNLAKKRMPRARKIQLGSKELASINPKKEPLPIEKLKALSGQQDLPDEEAREMVWSINQLAKILYGYVLKNANPDNLKFEKNCDDK